MPRSSAARVAGFLGEICGAPFPDEHDPQLHAARQDTSLMALQLRRAWESFLAAECSAEPLVLVLEDLHWGDLPSVQLVDAALRSLADQPLLVLAFARPEVHDIFPKLWEACDAEHMRLGALSKRGAHALVREALGPHVAEDQVQRIVDRAAGNAFYLEELIRAVAEGSGDRLPETVLAMVETRLERLSSEARRILRAASVFGGAFWVGGVRVLLGRSCSDSDVAAWLRALEAEEVVSPRPASRFEGQQEWTFRHALVQEAAYSMLTDADARTGHQLAATWLEAAGETDAMVLSNHFELGCVFDRAAACFRDAATKAIAGNDLQAATSRVERGLACADKAESAAPEHFRAGPMPEVRGALRVLQFRTMRWLGAPITSLGQAAQQAFDELPRGSGVWFAAAAELAAVLRKNGDRSALVELDDRLHSQITQPGAEVDRWIALARLGIQLLVTGAISEGKARIAALPSVDAQELVGEPLVGGQIAHARSWAAIFDEDYDATLTFRLAAERSYELAGDDQARAATIGNVGHAYMLLGMYPEARAWLERGVAFGTEVGNRSAVAVARHNLGLVLAYGNSPAEAALAIEDAAIAEFQTMSDSTMWAAAEMYRARILLWVARVGEAEPHARRAVELFSEQTPMRAQAQAVLALALLRAADGETSEKRRILVDEATACARAAMSILEEHEHGDETALCRLAYAECLCASGDKVAARAAIGAAAERLHAQAARFRDASRRASFLERVPEHARTLELAAWGWSGPMPAVGQRPSD